MLKLLSDDLTQYSESKLNLVKQAVVNMNSNSDDPLYLEKFTSARYEVLSKIDNELRSRENKNVIKLPASSQLDMFSILENDLLTKAIQVENRVDVNAENIIRVCSGNITLTMNFIKLADEYLASGSDFDLNQLIRWMQEQSIPVTGNNRSFKSTFVKDFYILIAEFLEAHYNVSESDSDNQAKVILEEAFDKEGFENDLLDVYKNTSDKEGGNRAIEVARLLVHYDIFDDNLITYFKNNL